MTAPGERIGLLVVHGIGEQRPLEHLRASAAEAASALSSHPELERMAVTDRTGEPDPAMQIDVQLAGGRLVELHFHEVWWADLGWHGGLVERARFWLWALGQWAEQLLFKLDPMANSRQVMRLPKVGQRRRATLDVPAFRGEALIRLALGLAGVLALLTLVSWSAVKRLVGLLTRRLPDPSLVFLFLGDVHAFARPGGPGRGTMRDPDHPPRVTIRRRMVAALVRMAQRPFDRWYVSAHSLGSVLAFNGLQEFEAALPNYLGRAEWDALAGSPLHTTSPYRPDGAQVDLARMMPRRPPWLADRDGIARTALFARLRGLVTFGSPLDKFAALWPTQVLINRQPGVFAADFEWLNLYDPTDPVANRLIAFDPLPEDGPARRMDLGPVNVAARSSQLLLHSHIRYFSPRPRSHSGLACRMYDAIVAGEPLVAAVAPAGLTVSGRVMRFVDGCLQAAVLLTALVLAGGMVVAALRALVVWPWAERWNPLYQLERWAGPPLLVNGLAALASAILLVVAAGAVRMTWLDWRARQAWKRQQQL